VTRAILNVSLLLQGSALSTQSLIFIDRSLLYFAGIDVYKPQVTLSYIYLSIDMYITELWSGFHNKSFFDLGRCWYSQVQPVD
jgi:hypothetical protein